MGYNCGRLWNMSKECKECSEAFTSKRSNQIYCSDFCKINEYVSCTRCSKDFTRQRNKKVEPYCSPNCRNIHTGKSVMVTCDFCEKSYYKPKAYVGRSKKQYCSEDCQHDSLRDKVVKTCKTCGIEFDCIPSKQHEKKFCSFHCKNTEKNISEKELIELYVNQNMSAESVGYILGYSESFVFKHLKLYGIQIRQAGNAGSIECEDGTLVRSSYEKIFSDKLNENNIEYEYDCNLPFHRYYLTDFKVKDVYIEIWGIVGRESYNERRRVKQALYKENDLKLINIFPEDFKDIDNKITELKRLIS